MGKLSDDDGGELSDDDGDELSDDDSGELSDNEVFQQGKEDFGQRNFLFKGASSLDFRFLHVDLDLLGVAPVRSLARKKFLQHPPLQRLPFSGSSSPRAAFLLMLILVVAGRSSLQLPSGRP
ncbi:uncharacterized protein LOC109841046 [Asparagus officinalis]|uniref:uncharacterized protein LOC109841046 n=1 Tax=Asparagus officinalis TaxID=4686 RepID=UPI00098E2427|nr:uncharacterized protein LOC109841046 [Asparagus officinalis]